MSDTEASEQPQPERKVIGRGLVALATKIRLFNTHYKIVIMNTSCLWNETRLTSFGMLTN